MFEEHMRLFSDFNELKAAVGTEIGTSEWIEITQDRINRFAEATCDEQWIHIDQDRAKRELPGGRTIAHGLLSLSLAPMFIRSVVGLKGLRSTLNYGADRIRYVTACSGGLADQGSHQHRGSGGSSARWLKGQLSHGG
jgi:acyl dehydratase